MQSGAAANININKLSKCQQAFDECNQQKVDM